MAIVIPIHKQPQAQNPPTPVAPPDPNYLLMAAAQMHSEGRLIEGGQRLQPMMPRGHEEWEPQGRLQTGEPMGQDQSQRIMQLLHQGKDI